MPLPDNCPALRSACTLQPGRRLPFAIAGRTVGSVLRAHLPALAECAPWLQIGRQAVRMNERLRTEPQRTAALAASNETLRERGLIRGWRNEIYAVPGEDTQAPLALIERAAARFWGTLTLGAHLNGYVADARGRPAQLWVARRSLDKATDAGKLDNLVGGGVPHGQTPFETLVRECWEESGIPEALARKAQPAARLQLHRDIPEGVQQEVIHAFDLALPQDFMPCCVDGEVMAHRLMSIEEVRHLLQGEEMTVDAAVVTHDFLRRHQLL